MSYPHITRLLLRTGYTAAAAGSCLDAATHGDMDARRHIRLAFWNDRVDRL